MLMRASRSKVSMSASLESAGDAAQSSVDWFKAGEKGGTCMKNTKSCNWLRLSSAAAPEGGKQDM
ncbi:hypothetical protein PSCICM_33630 [Pseudomonas cichorii]|uniref:Uncharacterized protein n=2 Tax=Pseudomonas cichorii TaxID=36746 RepID=A0ABQ1DH96_PSECI|nr:hypothetical protein PSCICJ_13090 [Pseudomonas cichorii]GFM77544.1 hypothetical protein PSCICM_33630 [Pseudomonas cichorii]GFM90345.1 hypothetical protein PSCICP_03170 [Pseudomonas cichorii]